MKNAPVLHRVEYALYRVLRAVLVTLPHTWSRSLGGSLGTLAWLLDARRRSVTRRNLALAFPHRNLAQREAWARACFRHFGRAFADSISALRFDRVEFCRRLTVTGWEHLDSALASGKGAFVLGAHLGAWEASAQPVALYRGGLHAVGRPADNPWLDKELRHLRERFGNQSIEKRGAARRMLRVLSAGGIVGILIDQRVQPREGIEVDFFGHPAWTSPVLARLSLRTGAPVVPLYGWMKANGSWEVAFRAPLLPPPLPANQPPEQEAAQVREMTRRYLAAVEVEIEQTPEQWLWLHDRWRRPE